MKKIMFGVLFLAVIIVISGCSAQFSPKSKEGVNSFQLPIPEEQENIRDHYAPIIEIFELSSVGCGAGNNSNLSCIVSYRIRATDDVGIKGISFSRTSPSGGGGGYGEWNWPGVKEYNQNGTWDGLSEFGNYSMSYTFTDFWNKTVSETRYFSLP
jgi:hypothetical protein